MVLRGPTTSVVVEHAGSSLRVDMPSHEAAGFTLAQRVEVHTRRSSVLVDAERAA